MAALTFSCPCRTLMVVVAAAVFISADQHHTGTNFTLRFQIPSGTKSWRLNIPDSDKYISYCQDRTPTCLEDQEELLKGWVEGMDRDKIDGTFTVTVRNPTRNASGPCVFNWVDSDERRFNETIFLNATDSGQPGGHTQDGGKKEDGSVGLIVDLIISLIVELIVGSIVGLIVELIVGSIVGLTDFGLVLRLLLFINILMRMKNSYHLPPV